MQAPVETALNGRIELRPGIHEYEVPGFFAAYEDHVDQHAAGNFFGWLLLICGGATVLLSIGILIFGPSEIYYSRYSGMTFWQHMQMRPGIVATVGSVLAALGSKLLTEGSLSREQYLLSRYEIVGVDGNAVSAGLQVCYLNESAFSISCSPEDADPQGAA